MKQPHRYILFWFLIIFSLSACQSIKDGLTGQKKSNSDEFLIKKKNPLILPPDFNKLPEPKILSEVEKNSEEEIDIKAILTKKTTSTSSTSASVSSDQSLEKSILEKIKDN